MTATTVEPAYTPPASVDRLGQATAVEQSRAVAEVQAAIIVAQQCPRSINTAVTAMRESCAQTALAERAFYRFPRGGQTVTGPSVHLARELARCWGNVQYGISELRRDDDHGQSEMQAYAWDVQTNTRSVQVFVVPHKRDKRDGPERLVDMRDIYENNANNGARRLREAIFAVLPPWFVEEAKELCSTALTEGGGRPLAQRIADSVKAFDEHFGVVVDQLEAKVGRPRDRWTEHDIAQLTVTFKSLRRGEMTVDEEFPPRRVTAAEIVGSGSGQQPPPSTAADTPPAAQPASDPADAQAPPDEPAGDGDDLETLSLEELRDRLRVAKDAGHDVKLGGNKDELVARLRSLEEASPTPPEREGGWPRPFDREGAQRAFHAALRPLGLDYETQVRPWLTAQYGATLSEISDDELRAVLDELDRRPQAFVAAIVEDRETAQDGAGAPPPADGDDTPDDAPNAQEPAQQAGQDSLADRAYAHADGTADVDPLQDRIRTAFRTLAVADHPTYAGLCERLEEITDGHASSSDWSGASESRLSALAEDAERAAAEAQEAS